MAAKKKKKTVGRPSGVVDQLQVSRAIDRAIEELKTLRERLNRYWKQESKSNN